MPERADEFVPVMGAVHRRTSLGVFLDLADRRVFIPAHCTSTPSYLFRRGDTVTMKVLRSFAEEQKLIA